MSQEADAIVVLGGRLTRDGECSPALARRIRRGVELFRAGAAPRLVMSGGGGGHSPEARVMRDAALAAGVPAAAIVGEPQSHNPFENACEVAALLRASGLDRVILV